MDYGSGNSQGPHYDQSETIANYQMTNPLFVLAVLCLNIVICEWLTRNTVFRYLGTALMVIVLTAIVANLGIIPAATNAIPMYDGIFTYIAPLRIFFLILKVNIRHLKKAGLPMIIMFLLGSFGTVAGVLIASYLVSGSESLGENYHIIAGMMTGTYVGGSANFNAVAIHYDLAKNGVLYAGTAAVDSIFTTLWMIISIALPKFLNRKFPSAHTENSEAFEGAKYKKHTDVETISPMGTGILIMLACGTLWLSDILADWLLSYGIDFPAILILTTIALILAQLPFVQKVRGANMIGIFLIYLFLAVIGAFCEIGALHSLGFDLAFTLIAFIGIIVLVHALIIFLFGSLYKKDWDLIAVASQANIGGSSTALALAKSFKRNDLLLPGILVGSLGTGIGTYYGFLMAAWLAP
ncbi:MAG: DUF819 family protein [Cyclobacteriaceae bacterium]